MNIAERARVLYREKVAKQSQGDLNDSIQASEDLKALKESPGWRRIEKFIEQQREGSEQLLDVELGSIRGLTLHKIVTAFFKYLYINQERRAYKKIQNYIRITIQKGEQNAERKRKAEESKSKKQAA